MVPSPKRGQKRPGAEGHREAQLKTALRNAHLQSLESTRQIHTFVSVSNSRGGQLGIDWPEQ